MDDILLQAEQISKAFQTKEGALTALRDVNICLRHGETLGIVGESGCGKTTLGRSLLRLHQPDGGRIVFDGETLFDHSWKKQPDMRPHRRKMQMIFQNPAAALNPRKTAAQSIAQALSIHKLVSSKAQEADRVGELLSLVGLRAQDAAAYPHALSGGQQQRVVIARAMAVEPKLLVCDEPVSALDMSIQAQIVALLKEMQKSRQLSCIFISHDISVVRQLSHRIAVMYLGSIVEQAESSALIEAPLHPYTRLLLDSVPSADPRQKIQPPPGWDESPSPLAATGGCPFYPRCPKRDSRCAQASPALRERGSGHWVACHLA